MSDTIEFSIPMSTDEDGFYGRECPDGECLGYFKVEPGTGLQGNELPCHCPYCGHTASNDRFWTQDQLEYARSVAMRKTQDYVLGMFKDAFPPTRPRSNDFLSISWKVKPGAPLPLRHYHEKQLETTIVCDACGLRYAVYGVFAYCPDCDCTTHCRCSSRTWTSPLGSCNSPGRLTRYLLVSSFLTHSRTPSRPSTRLRASSSE